MNMDNKLGIAGAVGFSIVQIGCIILKLLNVIALSWFIVFSPILSIAFIALIVLIIGLFMDIDQ